MLRLILILSAAMTTAAPAAAANAGPTAPAVLVSGGATAPLRGAYEIALTAAADPADPYFGPGVTVTFVRPDGSRVAVDGFFDGGRTFRARAYADKPGRWTWSSASTVAGLGGKSGTFDVAASALPGKLRKHPEDPRQFAYDSGEWFLHVGDTGYRFVVDTEPEWQAYIDQAAVAGFTKIRTWFCRSRSGVEALFAADRSGLDLAYWQEIDRRVVYAANRHPRVILKLILYGEDTAELLRYAKGDKASVAVARVAQARWSALPNVMWCVSNDREIVPDGEPLKGRRVPAGVIDRIGRDMAAREPWGTLLTNHQARFTGYAFAAAPWSDVITLEDLDQAAGRAILDFRSKGDDPVVNDEDRYELYKPPAHPRYFFRRLMWASLLSGGHATYGGLKTYEPFDGAERGVQGYAGAVTAGKLKGGADDFVHIHTFFREAGLTLAGFKPDDDAAGGRPLRAKACRDSRTMILYLANPSGDKPETDAPAAEAPSLRVCLAEGAFTVRWFDPRTGRWADGTPVKGPTVLLTAPSGGDWVAVLRKP